MCSTRALVILVIAALGFSGTLHAQTVLNIYGPGGPAAAMLEAAKAFGTAHSISVNFIAGPTPHLVEKAKQDADILFTGSESEFAKALPGAFVMKDAYPLYLRPAAILVRLGNPKNIRGFRDLLAPNVKVLTVAVQGKLVCGKTWQRAPET